MDTFNAMIMDTLFRGSRINMNVYTTNVLETAADRRSSSKHARYTQSQGSKCTGEVSAAEAGTNLLAKYVSSTREVKSDQCIQKLTKGSVDQYIHTWHTFLLVQL